MGAPGPGFFGKLRSHGDFVSRRLPPAMREPFDGWLQAGLLRSRAELGAAWTPTWGTSPLWRFMLAPGLCGPQAWCGVMMPSADRVGRCFPLVLAAGMDGVPPLADCLALHAAWFARLEDLALSSLDDGFSMAAFDAALQALEGAPVPARGVATAATAAMAAPAGPRVAALLEGVAPPFANAGMDGDSAWWTDGSAQVAPSLAVCPGLPPAAGFAALLDGRWQAHGWQLA
jgi:type VI secretion system protein ImpM